MASLSETYRTKKNVETADRCRVYADDATHPLHHLEINWLKDGGVRIRFPKSPDLYMKRAYLDGAGRTHVLEVLPVPPKD